MRMRAHGEEGRFGACRRPAWGAVSPFVAGVSFDARRAVPARRAFLFFRGGTARRGGGRPFGSASAASHPVPPRRRAGQAIVESLAVLLVLVAGFLLFFDFAYGAVARLLLNHAAGRVARADAVGFNAFHRGKALRVGLIPVSGRRLVPDGGRTVAGAAGELALARTYLQTESWPDAYGVLDYERWDRLSHDVRRRDGLCEATVSFGAPELLPWKLGRLFGAGSATAGETPSAPGWRPLRAVWSVEDHASLYLRR